MDGDSMEYGEWKAVPGIEASHLLVSSEGWTRLRSMASCGGTKKLGHPQKGSSSSGTGTRRVGVNGTTHLVHRLVARAFLGPPPALSYTVDHLNGNPDDNRVSNLRWATKSEQNRNQSKRKVQRSAKPVILTSPSGETSEYVSAIAASEAISANPGNISNAVHRGWKVNGYTAAFKPAEDQEDIVVEGDVERWKAVTGDPNLFVSTMGRVQWNRWSVMGHRTTPIPNKRLGGYCMVKVGDSTRLVHQVVLCTFHEPPPQDGETRTVDHINHIRHDNRLSNLRWATLKEQRSNRTTSLTEPLDLPLAPCDIEVAVRKRHYRRVGMGGAWIVRMHRQKRMWIGAKGIICKYGAGK